MTSEPLEIARRAAAFEREAHRILGALEAAPSRVLSLAETRKQIGILNLKQTELFIEAVRSAEHSLYRPAIVMAWAGFMDFLQEKLASDGFARLHAERPKWSSIKTIEDLREQQPDFAILDAAKAVGLLRKAEAKTLHGLLSKRNECAHPSGYDPGQNEALGFVSELLNRIPTIDQRTL